MSTPTFFHRIATGTVVLTAFLAPVWFLPLDGDSFSAHKQVLFTVSALVLGALWILHTLRTQKVSFTFTPLTLALLLIALTTAASAFLAPNRYYQFSGRFLLLASMLIFVLFGTPLTPTLLWKNVLRALLAAGSIASLAFFWQLTPWSLSVLLNRALHTQLDTSAAFTLFESPAMFYALGVPLFIAALVQWWQHRETHQETRSTESLFWLGSTALVGAGLIALTIALWRNPALRPILLPYHFGWGIAVENFKQLTRALFGLGPEEFLTAFHRFRDVSFNSTPYWTFRFRASSSEAFQVLSTTGFLGLSAWVALIATSLWSARHLMKTQPSLPIFLALISVLFWLVPFSNLLLIVWAVLLLVLTQEVRHVYPAFAKDLVISLNAVQIAPAGEVHTVRTHRPFAIGVALATLLVLAGFGYWNGKIYAARIVYSLSLTAAAGNRATQTYDLQQRAIQLDPTNAQYRRAYSATNLAIARALAQKTDLTEEQRQTFAQLVQQAIREGRLAAQLNPQETENWENLASLYSNMLDIEGAPTWASAALIQAIQTDPISPQLRSQVGQLYVELGNADQSLRFFEQAIQLKPDWPTAYYRYGVALEAVKQPAVAYQAYQKALSLLKPEDQDYTVVQDKVRSTEAAAKEAAAKAPPAQEKNAVTPSPTPAAKPGVFNTQSPSVPTAETPAPSPSPTAVAPTPTPTPEGSGIVLPDNVGF